MSKDRHICARCRTELSVDALACDACGMAAASPGAPTTGPALRPPPEPPAVTAPPPLPPSHAGSSVLSGRNPPASGSFPVAGPDNIHPSDETPPGYVTAGSLWKISARRPGRVPGEPALPETAGRGEAASVALPAPAGEHLGDTR